VVKVRKLLLRRQCPAGAHLFELPNKVGLPQDQWFIAQSIYRSWAFLGLSSDHAARPGSGYLAFPCMVGSWLFFAASKRSNNLHRLCSVALTVLFSRE
jgi:hypothetical protein